VASTHARSKPFGLGLIFDAFEQQVRQAESEPDQIERQEDQH
jgi:hypothetical protein